MDKRKNKYLRMWFFAVLFIGFSSVAQSNEVLVDLPTTELPSEQTYQELNARVMSSDMVVGRAGPPVGPPIGGETPIGDLPLMSLVLVALSYVVFKQRHRLKLNI